jgi:hypothetical protein
MRYLNTAPFIPANVNSKFFAGTTPHDFNYRRLYVPKFAKNSRPIPVSYGGINFDCKQDALRNLERMLREYLDYEFIEGEPLEILRELAHSRYGSVVPEQMHFVKADEKGLQVYILDDHRQLAGICYAADLV